VKYHYSYPEETFGSLSEARQWVEGFVHWYNKEHKHSAIKFVTPEQRHNGLDKEILTDRKLVIEKAKKENPACWNGRKTRNLNPVESVYLNPGKEVVVGLKN
jgi:putative transposase